MIFIEFKWLNTGLWIFVCELEKKIDVFDDFVKFENAVQIVWKQPCVFKWLCVCFFRALIAYN